MTLWPENFLGNLHAHAGLTLGAALFGVVIAVAFKWRDLRDLWKGPGRDQDGD